MTDSGSSLAGQFLRAEARYGCDAFPLLNPPEPSHCSIILGWQTRQNYRARYTNVAKFTLPVPDANKAGLKLMKPSAML